MITSRRSFFLGATAFLASPSIVRAASLMPVSIVDMATTYPGDPLAQIGYAMSGQNKITLEIIRRIARELQRMHALPIAYSPPDKLSTEAYYAAPYAFTDKIVISYDDAPVTADASRHAPRYRHEAA